MSEIREQEPEVSKALPESILWEDYFGEEFERRVDEAGIGPNDDEAGEKLMNDTYDEWNRAIMEEPPVAALEVLLASEEYWVGTEEELFEQIKNLTDGELRAAGPFPSTSQELLSHLDQVYEHSHVFSMTGIRIRDYRSLSAEELTSYLAPGWGQEAPVLVHRLGGAMKPNYWLVMMELAHHKSPILAAVLRSTKERHYWSGTTRQLSWRLWEYYPFGRRLDGLEMAMLSQWQDIRDTFLLDAPCFNETLLEFYRRMVHCSRILAEFGIKLNYEKRHPGEQTVWTIEAPHWSFADGGDIVETMLHKYGAF